MIRKVCVELKHGKIRNVSMECRLYAILQNLTVYQEVISHYFGKKLLELVVKEEILLIVNKTFLMAVEKP
jgi:hypothetical protein